jgi:hypothetical protein
VPELRQWEGAGKAGRAGVPYGPTEYRSSENYPGYTNIFVTYAAVDIYNIVMDTALISYWGFRTF